MIRSFVQSFVRPFVQPLTGGKPALKETFGILTSNGGYLLTSSGGKLLGAS